MDTKEAIKAQFMKEYTQKDFPVITVKALCAATPVARTTFYSYYDNTDDVRCEVEDDLICASNIISSCHVETVVCLSNKNAKPKDYVEIGVDAEDYYKMKDSE